MWAGTQTISFYFLYSDAFTFEALAWGLPLPGLPESYR